MDVQNMKNIVVLKDLPSNMVEEAFVILKSNVKIHTEELVKNNNKMQNNIEDKSGKVKNGKDYVIKEAEMLVADYIENLENEQYKNKNDKKIIENKYKRLKYLTGFLAIFSFISIISILLR